MLVDSETLRNDFLRTYSLPHWLSGKVAVIVAERICVNLGSAYCLISLSNLIMPDTNIDNYIGLVVFEML